MRLVDQMLKQWVPVNTIIREQFRKTIIKAIEENEKKQKTKTDRHLRKTIRKIKYKHRLIERRKRVVGTQKNIPNSRRGRRLGFRGPK